MLKLLSGCIKLTVFSLLILVLGNWLHWDGKTISDQVKVGMSHAEESDVVHSFRSWATKVTSDAKSGFEKKFSPLQSGHTTGRSGRLGQSEQTEQSEEISPSERQKLRALIRELNSDKKD